MEKLSPQFMDSCRREKGKFLRGENMTRIETFVDAAFAFAFTMLVISIDQIPQSPEELLELSKDIPAFLLSALLIGSIWLSHSNWSRVFGLQDRITVYLSLLLVMLVLVFVYPIKLMMQTTVLYFSLVWFGFEFMDTGLFDSPGWGTEDDVGQLFIYVAIGLMALSAILISFYQNALRFREELVMNKKEIKYCVHNTLAWCAVIVTAAISALIAILTSDVYAPVSGFIYGSLFASVPLAQYSYYKRHPELLSE
ncbi:MAG: DUF1211 domain-containing protein [Pseudomonadales bacterium]|nr:DUF1211 domain-containing protein [Pseudomonadales bacterium]